MSTRIIDLAGPDGNTFVLLGIAKNLCDRLSKSFKPIADGMMSADYENLLNVFEREFSDYVTFVNDPR